MLVASGPPTGFQWSNNAGYELSAGGTELLATAGIVELSGPTAAPQVKQTNAQRNPQTNGAVQYGWVAWADRPAGG